MRLEAPRPDPELEASCAALRAEVRAFLELAQDGLGDIRLRAVRLSSNYRAQPPLVDWTNRAFERIFPRSDDRHRGAIAFSAASLSAWLCERRNLKKLSRAFIRSIPMRSASFETRRSPNGRFTRLTNHSAQAGARKCTSACSFSLVTRPITAGSI